MPLLGFTKFREKLLDRSKRQTIRKLRKHPIKLGDKLYCYWKLRTKGCEFLFEATCTETFFITIQFYEKWLDSGNSIWRIDRYEKPNAFNMRTFSDNECEELAKRDGFEDALEMAIALKLMHGDLNNQVFQVIRW